jgi:hypothetical protein
MSHQLPAGTKKVNVTMTSTSIACMWGCVFWIATYAGCTDMGTNLYYEDPSGVQVVASTSSITIINSSRNAVYYFAIEQNTAAFTDWFGTCTASNEVGEGKTKEVAYLQVTGYREGCTVLLYWWHGIPDAENGLRPDAMRVLVVQTPVARRIGASTAVHSERSHP